MLDYLQPRTPIRRSPNGALGFTLFELIVIMIIMGLIAVTVLPNLPGLGAALARNQALTSIQTQLSQLADLAYADARTYYIGEPQIDPSELSQTEIFFQNEQLPPPDQASLAPLELPDGWEVSAQPPIFFFRNGFCTGGLLTLTQGKRVFDYALRSPHCDRLIDENS